MEPPPANTPDGIHPATTMPPGCMPDQPVRLNAEDGQACAHRACPAPEWTSFKYTPWSVKTVRGPDGRDCQSFCLSQTCPAGSGPMQTITCSPPCR